MPFGICSKPSKDDLTKEISVLVEIPDKSCIEVTLSKDAIGLECLENVAKQLGLEEVGYFGLCYKTKKGYEWWVVLEKPIKKQLEQHAASSVGLCINLKFKIHFFVAGSSWLKLQDKLTRNFYYLQLKGKILEGSLSCEKNNAVLLASYSAQAELGDYDAESYASFVENHNIFPLNVTAAVHSKETLEQQVINLYQHHRGMTSEEAQLEYITITQQLEGYGDEYYPAKGLLLPGLTSIAWLKDKDGFIILVGASFLGIVVRHPHGLPPAYFRWPDIVRISHNKKYFCIESTKTFNTIQFEMDDAPTAKYAWRMFVAHHQFCRLNLSRSSIRASNTKHQSNTIKPVKHELSEKTGVVTSNGGNSSCSSSRSVKGLDNPVFSEQDDCTLPDESRCIQEKDMVDSVSHDSSSSNNRYTLPRPQSLNLSSIDNRHDFLLHDDLCTSQNSLDHNPGLHCQGLFNSAAVTHEVGSSLSMDSGNPHGTQSLESLDDRNHNTPNTSSASQACSVSTLISRPARPVSLNLEQLAADNSSEATGRTSGYSTSNDSDLEEGRELDFDPEDEVPLSRQTQLEELEKIFNEGQVFTEFQKVERRSEKLTIASAQCGGNVEKNRYRDVVPYEETRVHLNPRNNSSGSDYINADFVKLDVGTRTYRYIATQGPMENTAADFWQMVWEQNVRIIVAATDDKINSKSACYPYWPEDLYGSRKSFDSFDVETVSIQNTMPYKVRTLSLQQASSKQRRIICHLHFTDWPDHGVPQDPKNFLEFLDELESARQQISISQGHAQEVQPSDSSLPQPVWGGLGSLYLLTL
ncbi:Tyrosine-protein phosphatase non-receptor type 21 [Desmophyllum pertusum]|uniref:protein-tyrosine-phosphatase n=1 Tax=Desmophyllum pertusum TaxID=174260 RepID=A0A9X0CR16_9CNID|nr:Tyrosine-protein phosphatase non-receptor type 21 [Desmophyllum pertusum]